MVGAAREDLLQLARPIRRFGVREDPQGAAARDGPLTVGRV